MDFEEWWDEVGLDMWCDNDDVLLSDLAKAAWEAGIQEGIDRIYRLYDICHECRASEGQHRIHCRRGR